MRVLFLLRNGVELISQGDLHEAVGVEGGLVEGIDYAAQIREVGIAGLGLLLLLLVDFELGRVKVSYSQK
jgi:hypothetical protein